MTKSVRAVAYYRKSTTKQEASLPEQKSWARKKAAQEDVKVVREFEDSGIPGDEIARRPGFLAMLEFCDRCHKDGDPIEAVLTWDADRFSRATSIVTSACLAQLMQAGVTRMLTAEGWTDFDNDMDRLMFNIKQDMAKSMYVKSLSGNVTRSCVERAKQGKWIGGRRPHGYTLGADSHLALGDAAKAEAARWLFREYATRDVSLLLLAEKLNRQGAAPPVGKAGKWTRYNVHSILTNPQYTGDLHYNHTHTGKYHRIKGEEIHDCKAAKTRSGKAKVCHNAGEDVIIARDAHPALVDRETFAAVQRKLEANKPGFGPGSTRRRFDWYFSGLLRCADCGSVMWGVLAQRDKNGKTYEWRKYVCSRYMAAGRKGCNYNALHESDLLDKVVVVVQEHFSDPERMAKLRKVVARQRKTQGRDAVNRVAPLRKQIADLESLIARGAERLVRLPPDMVDSVAAEIRKWRRQRDEAEAELKTLLASASAVEEEDRRIDEALARLQRLGTLIRKAKPDVVRELLQSLVERIELHFTHEDHGQRRKTAFSHGTLHLRGAGGYFSKVGIELPMSLK